MRTNSLGILGMLISGFLHTAYGFGAPSGTIELQARGGPTGFNLPDNSYFTNATVALNDEGQVAFALTETGPDGHAGIWFGGEGQGRVVYTLPANMGASDPSLNRLGTLVFEQHNLYASDGTFIYDAGSEKVSVQIPLQQGFLATHNPVINAKGHILFAADYGLHKQAQKLMLNHEILNFASTQGLENTSDSAYLFRAAMNDHSQIASKVRLGKAGEIDEQQPDEIRMMDPMGAVKTIAQDRDSDPNSPFLSFDNGVAINNSGFVAFGATLAKKQRSIWIGNGETLKVIAREQADGITNIEYFAPALNDKGWVAFRAIDTEGKRAIYLGNGERLIKAVTEGAFVSTDLGQARIGGIGKHFPAFGGGISLNSRGDIAFQCILTQPENPKNILGSAVFVAYSNPFESGDQDR